MEERRAGPRGISAYRFPERVNGILSTGVFGYIRDPDPVMGAALRALVPGGRLVILDGKRPDRLPTWAFRFILWISRPFGVTEDYFDKQTLESVRRHFPENAIEQMYGGMVFIATGTATRQPSRPGVS